MPSTGFEVVRSDGQKCQLKIFGKPRLQTYTLKAPGQNSAGNPKRLGAGHELLCIAQLLGKEVGELSAELRQFSL